LRASHTRICAISYFPLYVGITRFRRVAHALQLPSARIEACAALASQSAIGRGVRSSVAKDKRGRGPIGRSGFPEQRGDVSFDRPYLDHQLMRDFFVGHALDEQVSDVDLAGSQFEKC
jgi:hypothetical protein